MPDAQPAPKRGESWVALGIALRDLRVSREWTQSDLAKRTGIPLANISAYERATRHVQLDVLVEICAAFDLLVTEALDGVHPFGSRTSS